MSSEAQSEGLLRRLNLLQSDGSKRDELSEIAEVLVVAFGSGDRYYLCWKDDAGGTWQDSHGLPDELQAWLFPATGITRDFSTLQVILGQDDEFYASDKDGKISNSGKPSHRKSLLSFEHGAPRSVDSISYEAATRQSSPARHSSSPSRRRTIVGNKERPLSLASSASSQSRSRSASLRTDLSDVMPSLPTSPITINSISSYNSDLETKTRAQVQYQDAAIQTEHFDGHTLQEIPAVHKEVYVHGVDLQGGLQEYFRSDFYQLGDFFRCQSFL